MVEIKINKQIKESLYDATLSNGLRLIIIPRKGFSKQFAIYAADYGSNNIKFYPVGSDSSVETPLGVAHFLEHKMFDNENGVNVFEEFAKYGAQPNAFTSNDITAYYFTSTDNFYENLEILIKYVNNPYFTDDTVEKEKGIIAQEITMYDDEPDWALFREFLSSIYFEHPVKNDIAGTVKSIADIDRDALYLCYNNFYNPGNMVLVLAGDIIPDKAINYVEKIISEDKRSIPSGKVKKCLYNEPSSIARNYTEQKMDISRPKILYGFKDVVTGLTGTELLRRKISVQIALEIFAGRSGDFFNKLYDKQIIDESFDYAYEAKREYAHGYFIAETERYEEFIDEIKRGISEAQRNGLDPDAFERIKKSFIGSLLRTFNRPENIAVASAKYAFSGIDIFKYCDVLSNISFENITEAFNTIFNEKYCAVSLINPINNHNGGSHL